MPKLVNGQEIDITLRDTDGREWRSRDFLGRMIVLHAGRGEFCHTTRGEFALWSTFMHIMNGMNTELVYMVRGGKEEHRAYRETFKIRPRILIDEDGAVGEQLDVYEPHSYLREDYHYYMAPAVYLIDAQGRLCCYWLLSGPRGRPSPECLLGIISLASQNGWTY